MALTCMVLVVLRRVLGVSRAARLSLAGVQQLENPRDVLRVRSDNVALRHGPHVEHLATMQQHYNT